MGRAAGLLGLAALAALAVLLAALRPIAAPVAPTGFDLEDVTVVVPGVMRLEHRRVRGRDDRIEAVEPARREGKGPFHGRTVLPGLIDLHVHHPPAFALGERRLFALLFLRHGVTTVRDTGSALPSLLRRHARAIAAGARPGPRLLSCGPFLDGDPPVWPGARVVRTPEEARSAVADLAGRVDCLKLYNGLRPEVARALVHEAGERGLHVVAHVPWAADLRALPGVEIQHMMGLATAWNRVPDRAIARYVALSKRGRNAHTPTLVAFARLATVRDGAAAAREPLGRLLPRYYRELLWNPAANPLLAEQLAQRGRLAAMRRTVAALYRAGVPVLAGTDTMNPFVVPGAALWEELRLLADAGLGTQGAWEAATWRAAEALARPGLGRIAPGGPADLLVFGRDPSTDLENLGTLEAVVAAGRLYRVEALEQAAERASRQLRRPPHAPLSSLAARAALWWIGSGEPRAPDP